MRPSKSRAVGLAAALVGWSFAAPRVRWHPVPNASLGTGLVAITHAPLGLRPPRCGRAALGPGGRRGGRRSASPRRRRCRRCGRRWPSAICPTPGRVAGAAHPARNGLVGGGGLPGRAGHRRRSGFRADRRPAAAAAAFGLSHIVDARVTGQPVLATVLVTGAAGWIFGWLHERSGSLAAPMLAHLAVNEAAAVAALAVQHA